jgi:sugar phosphate isomerase/epimerase
MKLGIGTYSYAWAIGVNGYPPTQPMSALDFLHRCAEQGVKLVQIADNLPLDKLTSIELDALLAEAQGLEIAIEVGTRGIMLDHLRTYLQIAQRCQSPILRVVVDTRDHHPQPDEIVTTLRSMMPEFEQAGVTLAVENHDRFKSQTLVDILTAVNSTHIGICLDTVNSFGALEGPEVVVDTLGPHVVNLHIKDFAIRRVDHNMGFIVEGKPAGSGMLNVPALLQRLKHFGRDFNAIFELWPAPEADIEATIRKEQAWVDASIRYLRTLITD